MGRIESYNTAQESIDEIQAHDNRTESASSTERSTQKENDGWIEGHMGNRHALAISNKEITTCASNSINTTNLL